MHNIEAVLFDADGVLQRPTVPWRPAFKALFEIDEADLDQFYADISALEAGFLDNEDDFPSAMRSLLEARSWHDRLTEVLGVFNAIEVNQEIIEIVRQLRRTGTRCYLTTNQQSHRAVHMSGQLNYGQLFDQEFYSCRLGAAKPKASFFEQVLAVLAVPAESVLFIDDRKENVIGARAAGLHAFVFEEKQGAEILLNRLAEYGLPPPASGDRVSNRDSKPL